MRKQSHHYSIRLIDYMESQWREALQGKVHGLIALWCNNKHEENLKSYNILKQIDSKDAIEIGLFTTVLHLKMEN